MLRQRLSVPPHLPPPSPQVAVVFFEGSGPQGLEPRIMCSHVSYLDTHIRHQDHHHRHHSLRAHGWCRMLPPESATVWSVLEVARYCRGCGLKLGISSKIYVSLLTVKHANSVASKGKSSSSLHFQRSCCVNISRGFTAGGVRGVEIRSSLQER